MTRPIRDKDPERYRLITIRTDESRLWMTPSRNQEKLILGIIARYQEIFNIVIFAYCVLSNHYHLLVKAPLSNIDEFEENVNREIARRINWKNHRIGKFWARRYDDQKVISEEDLVQAFLYVTLNAVRHGLVQDPYQWGLLSSFEPILDEKPRYYSFCRYSEPDPSKRVTRHQLKLTPLPQFAKMTKKKRLAKLKDLLCQKADLMAMERFEQKLGFLGIDKIKAQVPGSYPMNTSRSPRPSCYTMCPKLRMQHRRETRERRQRYSEASARFRLGNMTVEFPEFSFKPPLHRKPRLFTFTPLPDDFFSNAA